MYICIFLIPSGDNQIIKKSFFPPKRFKDHLRGQPDFVLDEQCKVPTHYIAPTWEASKGLLYRMASF